MSAIDKRNRFLLAHIAEFTDVKAPLAASVILEPKF
jgi:hypothetical protein